MNRTAAPECEQGPTYKGNVGHLMQHWTLCEILTAAQRHASCLSYVDAHAMAPMARCRKAMCQTFDRVRDGDRRASTYELAWRRLVSARGNGYPNSAAFVREVWKGQVSMLLCEIDTPTVAALETWGGGLDAVTVSEGDWRERFEKGLPDAPLTLLSFDPYMYNRNRRVKNPGNLYPSDLELLVRSVDTLRGGIHLQLSTYSANDGNPQDAVMSSIDEILAQGRLRRVGLVRVNRQMMSLIYARQVDWAAELADLGNRFTQWLETCR